MQTWFLLSLLSPLLWAIVNHLDKYATTQISSHEGIGAIMILTGLFSAGLLPIAYVAAGSVWTILNAHRLVLILNGLINALACLSYLYAIAKDEASTVAPLFQLVPVFGYFLGNIFLDETLSNKQLLGSMLIVVSSTLLLVERSDDSRIRIKWKIALLMTITALLYASFQVGFKVIAVNENFWTAAFWEYTGITLSAILFLTIPKYRLGIKKVIKSRNIGFIKLNAWMESLNILGNLTTAYASLLSPIALVLVINSLQPIFVFAIGVFATKHLPEYGKEDISKSVLIRKATCILGGIIGTYVVLDV